MEILQLKYFMHTAKSESISQTAKEFFVPPSSVSASLKKLEADLGVALFDRSSNRIKLNSCGKILLNTLEKSEKMFKTAKIDMLNISRSPKGEINLLILTNRHTVTDCVNKFRLSYPDISFKIKHSDYDAYSKYNNFDIIVSDRVIDADNFISRPYVREEVFCAVSQNHRLKDRKSVDFDDIKNEKFICMPKGSSLGNYTDKIFKKAGIKPDVIIECDDPHYIRKYLNMNIGITLFPSVSWKNFITDSIRLLRLGGGVWRNSYIYTNKNSSDIVKLFNEVLDHTV